MNKTELINAVKTNQGITFKEAEANLENIQEVIKTNLWADKSVKFGDLGVFQIRSRKARKGRNPQTGAEIDIAAKDVIIFKPYQPFEAILVNNQTK